DGHCTCGWQDCGSPGKHPRTPNGVYDATTDPAVIIRWWGRWPNANVGVATGAASGVIVLDVDPRHGGDDSLVDLEQQRGLVTEAHCSSAMEHVTTPCSGSAAPYGASASAKWPWWTAYAGSTGSTAGPRWQKMRSERLRRVPLGTRRAQSRARARSR